MDPCQARARPGAARAGAASPASHPWRLPHSAWLRRALRRPPALADRSKCASTSHAPPRCRSSSRLVAVRTRARCLLCSPTTAVAFTTQTGAARSGTCILQKKRSHELELGSVWIRTPLWLAMLSPWGWECTRARCVHLLRTESQAQQVGSSRSGNGTES